jgi:hypothetical protein
MKLRQISQWIVGTLINSIVTVFLVKAAWEGNDKAILLVIVFYPMLIVANSIIWVVLRILKKQDAKIYSTMVLCLLILLIPVLFLASLY